MTTSLSDILTAVKNIVTALNDSARQTFLLAGTQLAAGVTAVKQVATGEGRLVTVSVTVGVAGGFIYDSAPGGPYNRPLYAIPSAVGVYKVDLPYELGLYISPAAGSTVTVSYSVGNLARGNL